MASPAAWMEGSSAEIGSYLAQIGLGANEETYLDYPDHPQSARRTYGSSADNSRPETPRSPLLHSRVHDDRVYDLPPRQPSGTSHHLEDRRLRQEEEEALIFAKTGDNPTPQPTPLPKKKLFVISCISLSDALSNTMLLPFVPFMVQDFFNFDEKDTRVGYYAGFIASSFSVAQFFSSFLWGYLSDHIGRRPVLMFGMLGTLLSIPLFGFSTTFLFAILARSASGLLSGNVGVSKTYLAEILDETNTSQGFSIIGTCYGVGSIIGPMIGGLLSQPAKQYPSMVSEDSFFGQFPYLLPCLVSSLVTLSALIVGYFHLSETKPMKSNATEVDDQGVLWNKYVLDDTIDGSLNVDAPYEMIDDFKEPLAADEHRTPTSNSSHLRGLFKNTSFLKCCALFGTNSFVFIMFVECFPLWAKALPPVGLGWESKDIGIAQAGGGVGLIIFQVWIFHVIVAKIGLVRTFQLGSILYATVLLAYPLAANITNTVLLWVVVFAAGFVVNVSGGSTFTATFVLVNNAVHNDVLGAANGFSQSVGCLVRAVGPSIGGPMFAWSSESGYPFPLNHYLAFVVMALLSLCNFGLTFSLPSSINRPLGA